MGEAKVKSITQTGKLSLPSLFKEGFPKIAQKVGEEATEVIVAVLVQDDQRLIEEVADLTYHTLVLLSAHGVTPAQVIAELDNVIEANSLIEMKNPAKLNGVSVC